jgi:hypothetical protein
VYLWLFTDVQRYQQFHLYLVEWEDNEMEGTWKEAVFASLVHYPSITR